MPSANNGNVFPEMNIEVVALVLNAMDINNDDQNGAVGPIDQGQNHGDGLDVAQTQADNDGQAEIDEYVDIQYEINTAASTSGGTIAPISDDTDDECVATDSEDTAENEVEPAYTESEHDSASETPLPALGLPHILTVHGYLADLETPVTDFISFDDYKLMCLAGPKVTLIFEECGVQIEFVCARKLLKDHSEAACFSDMMAAEDSLNMTDMFDFLPIRWAATTFMQLYSIMEGGKFPTATSDRVAFMTLLDQFVMADSLDMRDIKDYVSAKAAGWVQEMHINWPREFHMATELEADHRDADGFAPSPIMHELARLRDVQEAFTMIRTYAFANVIPASELVDLVSYACPRDLRDIFQAGGEMRPPFTRALAIADIQRQMTHRPRRGNQNSGHSQGGALQAVNTAQGRVYLKQVGSTTDLGAPETDAGQAVDEMAPTRVQALYKLQRRAHERLRRANERVRMLDAEIARLQRESVQQYAREHDEARHDEARHEDDCHEDDCHEDDCHEDGCHEDDCHEDDCHEDDCHEDGCHEDDCHEDDCHEDDCHEDACCEDACCEE
ncbi:hypothetical protein GE09DRAFT_1185957 [Coniochaeta sp. 2T2.1]|nr:hypothetical protein GE09DRAFT_1185957 [Coniochaeta sp. 2T2.1]